MTDPADGPRTRTWDVRQDARADRWAGLAAKIASVVALGFGGGFAVVWVVGWISLVSGGVDREAVTLVPAAALYVGGPLGALLGTVVYFAWLRRAPILTAAAMTGLGAVSLGLFFGLFGNVSGGVLGSIMGFLIAAVWVRIRFGPA